MELGGEGRPQAGPWEAEGERWGGTKVGSKGKGSPRGGGKTWSSSWCSVSGFGDLATKGNGTTTADKSRD